MAALALDQVLLALRRGLLRRGASPATIETVSYTARALLRWWRPDPPRELEEEDLRRYLRQRARRLAPVSLKAERVRLRILFRALLEQGLLSADPTEWIAAEPPIRVRPTARRLLGTASVARLLEAAVRGLEDLAPERRANALRDRAALELLYCLGLRAIELRRARIGDLDLPGGSLHVRSAKRERPRILPLPPSAAPWLERYLREARPVLARGLDQGQLLLGGSGKPLGRTGVYELVERVARRVQSDAHPHALRRSIATELVRSGVNVVALQAFLGHAHLTTTAIYVEVDRAELHRAVAQWEARRG